jgi:hypothetical protein
MAQLMRSEFDSSAGALACGLQPRIAMLSLFILLLGNQPAAANSFDAVVRPFVKQHCVTCHGPNKQKADLRLDKLSTDLTQLHIAEEWQFVLDELNGATMPPEKEPQPSIVELTRVLETLTYSLQEAKKLHAGKNQTTAIRRLNKREYLNSIRDLTGIALPPDSVLPDEAQAEYDTHSDGLFLSAFQIERYRQSGRKAVKQALARKKPNTPETLAMPSPKSFIANLESRYKSYAKVKAQAAKADKGKRKSLEAELAKLAAIPAELELLRKTNALPLRGQRELKGFGRDAVTAGQHKVSFRCEVRNLPAGNRAFLGFINGRNVEVTASRNKRMNFDVTLEHYGRYPKVELIVTEASGEPVNQPRRKKGAKPGPSANSPALLLERLSYTGPIENHADGSSFARVLGSAPKKGEAEKEYAARIITDFATRAYRGKAPDAGFVNDCVMIFRAQRDHGAGVAEAIVEPLATVLTSPDFLFLTETARTNATAQANQRQIAARLSMMLWSAPPDAGLLALAEKRQLTSQLPKQVKRLLADERAADFATGFTKQWLELHKLDLVEVSRDKHSKSLREWTPALEQLLRREPAELFLTLARENLSITNFIDSDFVVVNNRLARYYGLSNIVAEDAYQKVSLPANSPRGGLLGQAAILAMTGNGKRSSPVLRGAWIMDKILGHPAPPPPPNVPELEEQKKGSIKVMLEAHQRQPQCASCHSNIDPTGFAMESFDHKGHWLGTSARQLKPLLTGQLPDGTKYTNFHDYKKLLLERRDGFARSFVEHLSSYALGRQAGFGDAAEMEAILAKSGGRDARLRDLITAIVQSDAFLAK